MQANPKNINEAIGESGCAEASWEDLRATALADYEEQSTAAHSWSSVIPRAINFYFDNARKSKERFEYRVVWQREGRTQQVKRYAKLSGALLRHALLVSAEPWKYVGKKASDYVCCSGRECGCGGEAYQSKTERIAKENAPDICPHRFPRDRIVGRISTTRRGCPERQIMSTAHRHMQTAIALAESELEPPKLVAPRLQSLSEAHIDPLDHVHDYRKVPNGERTDRLRFVCSMFRCAGCGDSYLM
jgi:hypothetical protein